MRIESGREYTQRDYIRGCVAEASNDALLDAAESLQIPVDELRRSLQEGEEELEQAQFQVSDESLMWLSFAVTAFFLGPDDESIERDDIEVQVRHVMHATLREHRRRYQRAEGQP